MLIDYNKKVVSSAKWREHINRIKNRALKNRTMNKKEDNTEVAEVVGNNNREIKLPPNTLEQLRELGRKIQEAANNQGVNVEGLDVVIDDGGISDEICTKSCSEPEDEDEEKVIKQKAKEKIKVENYIISVVEYAIFNSFFYGCYLEETSGISTESYGQVDPNTGAVYYGGTFSHVNPWWFRINFEEMTFFVQTLVFKDNWGQMNYRLSLSIAEGMTYAHYKTLFDLLKKIAFNHSEYKGKCLKVKLHEGCFKGIEMLDSSDFNKDLILNDTQNKFIRHYINRLKRGSVVRYLFNGEPGTGKTESIRQIMHELLPNVTFVIPDFEDVRDLTEILESCEIFDPSVIVLDDIDLYLGSRDKGNYTRLLGQFLSFFDGVKKRKVSLLASTNDKGLVDRAAERPGRFNLILDFGFLEDSQIEAVSKMYLPEEYQIPEIYNALKGRDASGKAIKVTGAFIANLAENIIEMREDEPDWSTMDTICLIKESYAGFYASQVNKKKAIQFKTNNNED